MKRIIVDLDVVTIAYYPSNDVRKPDCLRLLERVKNREFEMVTPGNFDVLLSEWNSRGLVTQILSFYHENTSKFVDKIHLLSALELKNLKYDKLIERFTEKGVKEEDALIALTCSLESVDILVTFNSKHLRGKKEQINVVLKENGLKAIEICSPGEI